MLSNRAIRSVAVMAVLAGAIGPVQAGPTYTFTTVDVPKQSATNAFGINGNGQIVGLFVDASSDEHGFLFSGKDYTDAKNYTTIDVKGATFTDAFGINNTGKFGEIVGAYGDAKMPRVHTAS
jgi:probable HAF family extracellular repeat protein